MISLLSLSREDKFPLDKASFLDIALEAGEA